MLAAAQLLCRARGKDRSSVSCGMLVALLGVWATCPTPTTRAECCEVLGWPASGDEAKTNWRSQLIALHPDKEFDEAKKPQARAPRMPAMRLSAPVRALFCEQLASVALLRPLRVST